MSSMSTNPPPYPLPLPETQIFLIGVVLCQPCHSQTPQVVRVSCSLEMVPPAASKNVMVAPLAMLLAPLLPKNPPNLPTGLSKVYSTYPPALPMKRAPPWGLIEQLKPQPEAM